MKYLRVKSLVAISDSQLIIGQVNGTYEMNVPCLGKYLEKVKKFLESFNYSELEIILQSKNDHTDSLVKLASMKTSNANWLAI